MITCLTVPYFAAAIEQRDDDKLADQPLVIGGAPWENKPLFAYSRQMARCGVHPTMTLRRAHFLLPQACFLPARQPRYDDDATVLDELLTTYADAIEPDHVWRPQSHPQQRSALGGLSLPIRYYLDLDGLPLREALPLVRDLGQAVRQETYLAPAIGLAADKFTAQVAASLARPNHALPVSPGEEAQFLATRPVHFLPLSAEASRRLGLLGIRTLGQLARLPPHSLPLQFDPELARQVTPLYRRPFGQDLNPVQPFPPAATLELIRHFAEPVEDRLVIGHLLRHLAVELASDLQAASHEARELCLSCLLEGDSQRQERVTLRQPTAQARRLNAVLQRLFDQLSCPQGVQRLAVSLGGLTPARAAQLALFDRPELLSAHPADRAATPAPGLDMAVADVIAKYGRAAFYRPVVTDPDHPLPERRFELDPITAW